MDNISFDFDSPCWEEGGLLGSGSFSQPAEDLCDSVMEEALVRLQNFRLEDTTSKKRKKTLVWKRPWIICLNMKTKDLLSIVEARVSINQTLDFLYEVFGRNSFDDLGTEIFYSVNNSFLGFNAKWEKNMIFYGIKNKPYFKQPARDLTITAHEIGHGIIQSFKKLSSFESCSLEESLADVFSIMTKQYAYHQTMNLKR